MRVIGLIFTGLLVGVSWLPTSASAGGTATCAADRPCIVPYMSGTKVIFENRSPNWDAYNIIYPTANGHTQIENSSGNFTVHGVKGHNQVVRIKVQGCNKHTLRPSTCSPWTEARYQTD